MRVFQHPNLEAREACPICHKLDDKPVVLIAKEGTEEGHNVEAIQVHLECLDLWYSPLNKLIYQRCD